MKITLNNIAVTCADLSEYIEAQTIIFNELDCVWDGEEDEASGTKQIFPKESERKNWEVRDPTFIIIQDNKINAYSSTSYSTYVQGKKVLTLKELKNIIRKIKLKTINEDWG